MEFHEKLKELRTARGLTQEELAELLFVSRTAVSKWESGRGYPNIDSLKALSAFFTVSLDKLICSEAAIALAEKDKKESIFSYAVLLCCALDVLCALLLFLPIFGTKYVSVFAFTEIAPWVRIAFISVIGITVLNGICGFILLYFEKPLWHRHRLITGIGLSVLGSLLFIAARQPYAAVFYFAFLLIKLLLLFKAKTPASVQH